KAPQTTISPPMFPSPAMDNFCPDPELAQLNLSAYHEANFIFAPKDPRPLPVLVVTGFLGSGKTTLVKRLLSKRGNLKVAALAHDLASGLNVDAEYLAEPDAQGFGKGERAFSGKRADAAVSDGDVAALSGCACCPGFDGSLSDALRVALKNGADVGLLDYLVLETSGSADPRRLVAAMEVRFGPLARVRLDRVVAVVDSEQLLLHAERWLSLAARSGAPAAGSVGFGGSPEDMLQLAQLAVADVVLLNKADLLPNNAEARLVAESYLQQLCPQAKILTCSYGDVPLPELLDVAPAQVSDSPAISHEQAPACWEISPSLDSIRSGRATDVLPGTAAAVASGPVPLQPVQHHVVVEWSSQSSSSSQPVGLARLQHFLCRLLPRWRKVLRRGKGVLWMAEDPSARWEWEVSGRLRYTCRRSAAGFGGAQPWSGLVLIFAAGFPESEVAAVRECLSSLNEPHSSWLQASGPSADMVRRYSEAAAQIVAGSPSFELLEAPPCRIRAPGAESTEEDVQFQQTLRFRLTGRAHFGLSPALDLSEPPYRVDVDAMNSELARIVSAAQGGVFLAVGQGRCPESGQTVSALLWAVPEASDCDADLPLDDSVPRVPEISLLEAMLAAARNEATPLLQRYFGHVTSCMCGQ
ncbi:unnamed protein product, partial [Polarella glacialis]